MLSIGICRRVIVAVEEELIKKKRGGTSSLQREKELIKRAERRGLLMKRWSGKEKPYHPKREPMPKEGVHYFDLQGGGGIFCAKKGGENQERNGIYPD